MIFKLLNERSFNLNNRFFFLFIDRIKILSKDNMKRNFVQKLRYPHLIGNIKKSIKVGKNPLFFLKER